MHYGVNRNCKSKKMKLLLIYIFIGRRILFLSRTVLCISFNCGTIREYKADQKKTKNKKNEVCRVIKLYQSITYKFWDCMHAFLFILSIRVLDTGVYIT